MKWNWTTLLKIGNVDVELDGIKLDATQRVASATAAALAEGAGKLQRAQEEAHADLNGLRNQMAQLSVRLEDNVRETVGLREVLALKDTAVANEIGRVEAGNVKCTELLREKQKMAKDHEAEKKERKRRAQGEEVVKKRVEAAVKGRSSAILKVCGQRRR